MFIHQICYVTIKNMHHTALLRIELSCVIAEYNFPTVSKWLFGRNYDVQPGKSKTIADKFCSCTWAIIRLFPSRIMVIKKSKAKQKTGDTQKIKR